MKRIASILLTIAMILSLVCVAGTVTTGAASAPKPGVSLYSCNPTFSKYGGTTFEVFIQTRNTSNDPKVYVHYRCYNDQPWTDREAEYYTTMSDGSIIWKASFTSWSTKYCLKLVNNGKTYWDNNNGKDYTRDNTIGSAPIFAKRLVYQYGGWSDFRIDAVLQNYAYHKNVFVRYTTNGWKSHHDVAMHYSETNDDKTETWTASIPFRVSYSDNYNTDDFEYAICYRVNGKEYWANYFGDNFGYYYYIHQ